MDGTAQDQRAPKPRQRHKRIARICWERWADDCRDGNESRLNYPRMQPWAKDILTGYREERWTPDRDPEYHSDDTRRLSLAIAESAWVLGEKDERRAMALRARYRAGTDYRLDDLVKLFKVSSARVSQMANEAESWVEERIYGVDTYLARE
jgi:hypothetical protein